MRFFLGLFVFFTLIMKVPLALAASVKPVKPVKHKTTATTINPAQSPSVDKIDPQVLKLALNAYNCALGSGIVKQKLLTIIDYSRPATEKRLYVLDVEKNQIILNTYVAHGQGSGQVKTERFSNTAETHASSIGLFLTGTTYQGKHGNSLKLQGLEKGFNDQAESRNIVVHGASYVNEQLAKAGRMGRSWGCPAVPQQLATPLVNTIKNGALVFSYYPDKKWLEQSKYVNCSMNRQLAAL